MAEQRFCNHAAEARVVDEETEALTQCMNIRVDKETPL